MSMHEEHRAPEGLKPLSSYLPGLLEVMASAIAIAPNCESPIEVDVGARLSIAVRLVNEPTLLIVPQYVLGPYRYDFAVIRKATPLVLIECDGKEFHSTADQQANDRAKDRLAAEEGIFLFRFAGSEIFRDVRDCVRRVFKTMRLLGHLTQQQWDVVELNFPPRPRAGLEYEDEPAYELAA